jgi:flagellar basal-body rod modification protein FlgD
MSVAATSSSTSTASTSNTSATLGTSASQQDKFLTLLIAQMKSQDPLNPMDNAQLTSQLAQISTVEGVDKLNTTVQSLLTQMGSIDQLNATSMIGHNVLVPGTRMELSRDSAGNAVAGGAVQLTGTASSVQVQVRDAAGNLVRTVDLGNGEDGINVFTWDGKTDAGAAAPDGRYTFGVTATNNGANVPSEALSIARVDGVQRNNGTLMLDLGGFGLLAQSQVRQIF